LGSKFQKTVDLKDQVICMKCGGGIAIRINRIGFWQRKVACRFGYYPWKCGGCGRVFLFRRRGQRNKPRKPKNDPSRSRPSESPQT